MTDDQIGAMVNRFLTWKLPRDFSPDGGISYSGNLGRGYEPVGTNLLTYTQAEAMIRHMLNL